MMPLVPGPTAEPWSVRVTHCRIDDHYTAGGRNWTLYLWPAPVSLTQSEWRLSGCAMTEPPGLSDDAQSVYPSDLAVYDAADYVLTHTEGYGPQYGEWLLPQLLEGAYRIAGTETLAPDDSPEDVQIQLYRETAYESGRMERYAWLETSPDPITGEWQFQYLPTTDSAGNPQRYALAINRPAAYAAELLRWYEYDGESAFVLRDFSRCFGGPPTPAPTPAPPLLGTARYVARSDRGAAAVHTLTTCDAPPPALVLWDRTLFAPVTAPVTRRVRPGLAGESFAHELTGAGDVEIWGLTPVIRGENQ